METINNNPGFQDINENIFIFVFGSQKPSKLFKSEHILERNFEKSKILAEEMRLSQIFTNEEGASNGLDSNNQHIEKY